MTKVRGPLLFPCLWRVFVSILFIVPQLHWTESTDPYPYLVSFLMLIKLSAFSQCLQHLSCSIICPRSTILLPFFQLWSLFPSKDAASTSTVSETSGKKKYGSASSSATLSVKSTGVLLFHFCSRDDDKIPLLSCCVVTNFPFLRVMLKTRSKIFRRRWNRYVIVIV